MFISLLGVKININESLYKGLIYIYGMGRHQAGEICLVLGISKSASFNSLTLKKRKKFRLLLKNMVLGPRLLQIKMKNIKFLKSIKSYRGFRHKFKLSIRGQRTRTNAKTRRKGIA
jgi:small subunit ribosomal protein S13